MTDLPAPTPQPPATADGVPLAPLAGGFLPPMDARARLIADLPAPTPGPDGDVFGNPFPPEAAEPMAAWDAPFGQVEATHAVVTEETVAGPHGPVPVRVYRPEPGWTPSRPSAPDAAGRRAGLVWYHGGAFLGGDLDMPEADAVSRGLVTRTGCTVVSVDYRLCNDGTTHFPVPHDDAYAAWRWTHAHAAELGIDATRLAVGGGSAGGALATSVALHARDDAAAGTGPAVWQALLMYPVAHHLAWPEPSAELAARLEEMPQILRFPAPVRAAMNANYLGPAGEGGASPAYAFVGDGQGSAADLSGYPDTYIENCENDDLRASGEGLARQLASAGVQVECVTAAGVAHGHLNAVALPQAYQTMDRLAARLARP